MQQVLFQVQKYNFDLTGLFSKHHLLLCSVRSYYEKFSAPLEKRSKSTPTNLLSITRAIPPDVGWTKLFQSNGVTFFDGRHGLDLLERRPFHTFCQIFLYSKKKIQVLIEKVKNSGAWGFCKYQTFVHVFWIFHHSFPLLQKVNWEKPKQRRPFWWDLGSNGNHRDPQGPWGHHLPAHPSTPASPGAGVGRDADRGVRRPRKRSRSFICSRPHPGLLPANLLQQLRGATPALMRGTTMVQLGTRHT